MGAGAKSVRGLQTVFGRALKACSKSVRESAKSVCAGTKSVDECKKHICRRKMRKGKHKKHTTLKAMCKNVRAGAKSVWGAQNAFGGH